MTWTPYPLPKKVNEKKKQNKKNRECLKLTMELYFYHLLAEKPCLGCGVFIGLKNLLIPLIRECCFKKCFFRSSVIREHIRVCSFRGIQKRIFDPRFRGRKEREIRNWICNLSQTHCSMHDSVSRNDVFSTVCQIMRLYSADFLVGSSNSDDGT